MLSQSRLEQDYVLLKILGSGAFGVVFDCRNKLDEKRSAVKVTFLMDPSAQKEVSNLARLPHHDNIVEYHSCWKDTMTLKEIKGIMGSEFSNFAIPAEKLTLDLLCIQMELCSENLRDWLGRQTSVSKDSHSRMSLQMAKGLQHIHSNDLIHRDLKPENIFLSTKGELKIGDLGISTNSHQGSKYFSHTKGTGTPLYLAPEQETTKYGKEVDIFAFGLILFELSTPEIQPGRNGGDPQQLLSTLTAIRYKSKFPKGFNEKWEDLQTKIEKMIEFDPAERANIQEAINFFSTTSQPHSFSPNVAVGVTTQSNLVVHQGVACNGCGLKEIRGVRYKCSVCLWHNLCDKCEKRVGIHDESHPLLKLQNTLPNSFDVYSSTIAKFASMSIPKTNKLVIPARTVCEFNKALLTALPGSTIQLEEGNYNMQVKLHKNNVKIIGRGSKTQIITVAGLTRAIEIVGNHCEIRDMSVIVGNGVNGLAVFGNHNVIKNVDLEGQNGDFGLWVEGDSNKVKNISAKNFIGSLDIGGNSNIVDTVRIATNINENRRSISVVGDNNKICNVTIDDTDGQVVIEGKENEASNCMSTSRTTVLIITKSSSFCKIFGGLFKEVLIDGTNNQCTLVVATQTFFLSGSGHVVECCKAPQLKYLEIDKKNLIKMVDNSFDKVIN